MGTNDFWTNAYNQIHNLWTTIGVFIVLELAQYVLDNATWTWRGLIVAVAGAVVKYLATRDDHVKTDKAVRTAAVTGTVPGKVEGE